MHKPITRAAASVALAATLGACTAAAESPAPQVPDQKAVSDLLVAWKNALASGSAEKVADLYAPDAVLLPFNTNDIRTGRPDLVDYYERFLLNYPVARVEQQRVDIPDTHTATDTGVLSFVLHQEGKEPVVRARYTVMYAKAGDKWLIINHHLSQLVTSQ